jgi:alanine racemase
MWNPRVWAEVRLDRLRANLRTVARAAGAGAEIMAVVKADAYGHGAAPVARALLDAGAARLGVGDSTEAIELREAGITAPIHVLGALVEREIDEVIYHGITPAIHSLERVRLLDEKARRAGRRLAVHLMVDTGMGRLGVRPESAADLMSAIVERPHLRLEGVATHLSCAAQDPEFTAGQVTAFRGVLARARARGIPLRKVHAAATAGIFFHPAARFNLVRPGAALYGIDPGGLRASGVVLEPVLSLKTQIVFLKSVEKGTPIGYGATYRTPAPTRIATLPCGYDDGYPYTVSGKGAHVLLGGRRCPVVGTVTMDYLLVDVGACPDARIGDTVTLIGRDGQEEVRAEDIARLAGTIPYAIPCQLGKRVRRVYLAETDGAAERDEAAPDAEAAPLEASEAA